MYVREAFSDIDINELISGPWGTPVMSLTYLTSANNIYLQNYVVYLSIDVTQ